MWSESKKVVLSVEANNLFIPFGAMATLLKPFGTVKKFERVKMVKIWSAQYLVWLEGEFPFAQKRLKGNRISVTINNKQCRTTNTEKTEEEKDIVVQAVSVDERQNLNVMAAMDLLASETKNPHLDDSEGRDVFQQDFFAEEH